MIFVVVVVVIHIGEWEVQGSPGIQTELLSQPGQLGETSSQNKKYIKERERGERKKLVTVYQAQTNTRPWVQFPALG